MRLRRLGSIRGAELIGSRPAEAQRGSGLPLSKVVGALIIPWSDGRVLSAVDAAVSAHRQFARCAVVGAVAGGFGGEAAMLCLIEVDPGVLNRSRMNCLACGRCRVIV